MSKACEEEQQLINQHEVARKRMKMRIEELAKSYGHTQPLSQYFALLHNDPELKQLDKKLCDLEKQLSDSYQFDMRP